MKKRLITSIILCLIVSLGLAAVSVPAYAASTTETNELISTGTLCELAVSYTHGGRTFRGETVRIWRVASVSEDYQYTALEPFSSLGLTLNGVTSQTEWTEITNTLTAYAETSHLPATASGETDSNGTAHFNELETGLYLVAGMRRSAGGSIYTFEPFVVSLPNLNDHAVWMYTVESHPKADRYTPTSEDVEYKVVKLWRDSEYTGERPTSVEIEIYKDSALIKTVTLNSENRWTYSWTAKDDSSVWQVIEKNIPSEYTMSVQKTGWTFTVTNTASDEPTPPDDDGGEDPPDTPDEPTPPGDNSDEETPDMPNVPKTGDSSNLLLWVMLALISGIALIVIGVTGKKQKNVEDK